MTSNPKKPSRLRREILAMATDMHAIGTMDDATYGKIAARLADAAALVTVMQASPCQEIEIEAPRGPMPVRDSSID
jgi:hypothetical protein